MIWSSFGWFCGIFGKFLIGGFLGAAFLIRNFLKYIYTLVVVVYSDVLYLYYIVIQKQGIAKATPHPVYIFLGGTA